MNNSRQSINVEIPVTDFGFLQSIGQEKGWVIHLVQLPDVTKDDVPRQGWEKAAIAAHQNGDDVMMVSEDEDFRKSHFLR